MFKNAKNDYTAWLVFIGIVVLLLEILFFNSGLIFSLFIAGGMIYLGRKRMKKKFGRLLFYGGIVFFAISIFNMMTFKFLLLAILLHFFIQYLTSKRNPNKMNPQFIEPVQQLTTETLIKTKPLFENKFIGQQKTPNGVYEWDDINIQTGIGDTVIDLSFTMLPKGETVIFIRNIIGNVHVLVPYELEVSIHHSGIMGGTKVFEHQEQKIFNQVYQVKTPGYDTAEQKIKIFTSLIVGNLEVSRI
ncbi:cell wall-active antibiotics response protein LiaF [Bacillus sp. JJ1764]|uniref:cell wall-active antibiotics response protein LiaF n=1 Tax=Bacillus sp. JJ1764 TaxID=3122964 RepID=UPI002FFF3D5F